MGLTVHLKLQFPWVSSTVHAPPEGREVEDMLPEASGDTEDVPF